MDSFPPDIPITYIGFWISCFTFQDTATGVQLDTRTTTSCVSF